MPATDKIEEAEFYLAKMRESYNHQKEFIYYLNAFLPALRSAPEYLLEEYNSKYNLGIPLTDWLDAVVFESRAKQINHKDALDFIKFWKDWMKTLTSDVAGSLLFTKRRLGVHRIQTRPTLVKVTLTEVINIRTSVRIEKYDKEGKFIGASESKDEEPKKTEEGSSRIDWFFKEYENEPIIVLCEKSLKNVKAFVDEAYSKFP